MIPITSFALLSSHSNIHILFAECVKAGIYTIFHRITFLFLTRDLFCPGNVYTEKAKKKTFALEIIFACSTDKEQNCQKMQRFKLKKELRTKFIR